MSSLQERKEFQAALQKADKVAILYVGDLYSSCPALFIYFYFSGLTNENITGSIPTEISSFSNLSKLYFFLILFVLFV